MPTPSSLRYCFIEIAFLLINVTTAIEVFTVIVNIRDDNESAFLYVCVREREREREREVYSLAE